MSLIDIISAPRIGYYDAENKISVSFEYSRIPINGSRINGTIALSGDGRFDIIGHEIKKGFSTIKKYLSQKDLGFLDIIMSGIEGGVDVLVHFGKDGLTLAKVITIDAKNVDVIFEKYARNDYAFQLAFTEDSSIKFPWSDAKLVGQFYFNLKGSTEESHKTITGYTNFHLGNTSAATPVTLSAGVMKRQPISDSPSTKDEDKKARLEEHTYALLQSRKSKGITVKEILSLITPKDIDIPDALDNVAIHNFGILKSKKEGTKSLAIICDCVIKINKNKVKTKLTIISKTVTEKKDGKSVEKHEFIFKGKVTVGEHKFNVIFQKESEKKEGEIEKKSSWSLLADYDSGKTVMHLEFKKLAVALFGDDIKDSMPDLTLDVKKFKAFFYYKKTEGKDVPNKMLFGMGAGVDVDVKNIPMAGPIIVEAKAFKFTEVLALYAQGDFTEKELKSIKALPKPKDKKKKIEIGAGVNVTAVLEINGEKEVYTVGGKSTTNQKDDEVELDTIDVLPTADQVEENPEVADVSKTATANATWKTIDKKIGPVNLQRLGLAYHNNKLVVLLDASIEMKGMGMQLMGLGLGFKLNWDKLEPDFYLRGLGVSYKKDPVEISGLFLKGAQNGVTTYNGAAVLKLKKFSISAMGSYATVGGKSSLFIYGLYQGNIGGDPMFFVTGIAAGFGYNRKINAPDITEVADYPLVALAMNPEKKDLMQVLSSLETPMSNGKFPIELAIGNYWLALGIKFTSFGIIESFVLLTVNFGANVEFNVLGLSRLSFPKKNLRDKIGLKDPIVYIEIAIKVSFASDSDVIKVDGLITPSSYILSKDCKVTGGFAFYTWVSGEHAGDFVLSVGGYHPRYTKPAHYPQVPRVALNWKFSDKLALHGELYFALTPSAIMMGGLWSLLFKTSEVRVSFVMWIDILLEWAPFHYDIGIGIIISLEAHIKCKLVTIHLNFELRAELVVWGPPFAGRAILDLGVFSYEMEFGKKDKPDTKRLDWESFKKSYLPKDKNNQDEIDVLTISVQKGVMQVIEDEATNEKYYVANPLQVEIGVDSTIPVNQYQFNEENDNLELNADHKEGLNSMGIKPCGFDTENTNFVMSVSVKRIERGEQSGKKEQELLSDTFSPTVIDKSFTAGLWGSGEGVSPDDSSVVRNIPSGMILKLANGPKVSSVKEYDFSLFREPWSNKDKGRNNDVDILKLKGDGSPKPFNGSKSYQSAQVANKRKNIVDEIYNLALGIDESYGIDEKDIEETYKPDSIIRYFRYAPNLCEIGSTPNKKS